MFMPSNLIILFAVIPMLAGTLTLVLTGRRWWQVAVGLVAVGSYVLLSLWGLLTVYRGAGREGVILVSQLGSWPAPFGISLILDPLAGIMLFITSIVVAAIFVYSVGQIKPYIHRGFFHPLFHLLVAGVHCSFLTGDLFNLFVAFEIMLMASYVMLVIEGTTPQMRQAYKYILLNLIASLLFVTCAGLIYGQVGTLSLADLARMSLNGELSQKIVPVFALLLVVFGVKTAIFPLWFWLPDTYPTVDPAIGALFSGLLTKVGAYVLVRVFVMTVGSPGSPVAPLLEPVIMGSAAITMFLGVLGAVSMQSIRRILSIHIISQVGYMILGIGMGIGIGVATESRQLAVAGAIFFILHNMVVKSSLFLCGGLMSTHAGSDHLRDIGGLARRAPWLASLFLIAALSLAGLPPLSGFFGKWILIRETFATGRHFYAAVAIATSLLTLMSMLKIWSYGFWSPPKGQHVDAPATRPRVGYGMVGIAILVAAALSMGIGAQAYYNVCMVASRSLVDPAPYVRAVMGEDVPLADTSAASQGALALTEVGE
jgi:multicomponent Na+:H+ antiporter subunit D